MPLYGIFGKKGIEGCYKEHRKDKKSMAVTKTEEECPNSDEQLQEEGG